MSSPAGWVRIPEDECWKRLREQTLGRIALAPGGDPEIFPVNYAVVDHGLYLRTAPGTKLAALMVNEAVAVEIDGLDSQAGWSVILHGRAHPVEWADIDQAERSGLRSWPALWKPVWIHVAGDRVTGRRYFFGPEPDPMS